MHLRLANYIIVCCAMVIVPLCGFTQNNPELSEEDIFEAEIQSEESAPAENPDIVSDSVDSTAAPTTNEPTNADILEEPPTDIGEAPIPVNSDDVVQTDNSAKPAEGELSYAPDVEIEKSVYLNEVRKKSCNCEYTYLTPYRDRRNTFGFVFGVGFSQYQPNTYKPDFVVNETYETYYGYPETPMAELQLAAKWNMGIGSISLETAGGYFFNRSKDDSVLKVMPVRAGLQLALDTLSEEPVFVPYGGGGVYTAFYEERLASQAVGGNTGIGFYANGGLMLQLNGLDEDAAIRSFDETGLENTFVFAEARYYLNPLDGPSLGSSIHAAAGLRLEY